MSFASIQQKFVLPASVVYCCGVSSTNLARSVKSSLKKILSYTCLLHTKKSRPRLLKSNVPSIHDYPRTSTKIWSGQCSSKSSYSEQTSTTKTSWRQHQRPCKWKRLKDVQHFLPHFRQHFMGKSINELRKSHIYCRLLWRQTATRHWKGP